MTVTSGVGTHHHCLFPIQAARSNRFVRLQSQVSFGGTVVATNLARHDAPGLQALPSSADSLSICAATEARALTRSAKASNSLRREAHVVSPLANIDSAGL